MRFLAWVAALGLFICVANVGCESKPEAPPQNMDLKPKDQKPLPPTDAKDSKGGRDAKKGKLSLPPPPTPPGINKPKK